MPEYDGVKLPGYEAGGFSGVKGDLKGGEDDAIERGHDPFADREPDGTGERNADRV